VQRTVFRVQSNSGHFTGDLPSRRYLVARTM
jgi:hypothetical protein